MIEGIEKMICLHKNTEEETEGAAESPAAIMVNPATKKHCELQIKTLQNAPRDVAKLKRIIDSKEKRREEDTSMHVFDIQDLVTEIEMLMFVLVLVRKNSGSYCS
jgi:hypothetical protein